MDSRQIQPGDVYVALPGLHTHGGRFAKSAVAAGAVAVLTDAQGAAMCTDVPVPVLCVDDPRSTMAAYAATIYGHPADKATMLAVTGTTGKTSTVFLIAAGLTAAGYRVGTIGTIGFRIGAESLTGPRTTVTTPEAPDIQALLALMLERGVDAVAMEVTSHALAFNRVGGIRFDVAGFTNLGRDHLDYHHDQEHYYQAKAQLFQSSRTRNAVVGVDDPWGRRLAEEIRAAGAVPVRTTSLDSDADYTVLHWHPTPKGVSQVRFHTPHGDYDCRVGMMGEFNIRNALTAMAMLDVAGVDLGIALPGFERAWVPGRMQRVDLGEDAPAVVVDFAHTPESVAAALDAIPRTGRLIAVLGCGGDRDPVKRGPMGAAAATRADVVVVTDDNPRSEDPASIRAAVLAGARAAADTNTVVIDGGDRRSAIRLALELAGPDDWIAILGKGHEHGQEIQGVITPFNDIDVATVEWQAKKGL